MVVWGTRVAWHHPLELSPKAVSAVLGKRGFGVGVIDRKKEGACVASTRLKLMTGCQVRGNQSHRSQALRPKANTCTLSQTICMNFGVDFARASKGILSAKMRVEVKEEFLPHLSLLFFTMLYSMVPSAWPRGGCCPQVCSCAVKFWPQA